MLAAPFPSTPQTLGQADGGPPFQERAALPQAGEADVAPFADQFAEWAGRADVPAEPLLTESPSSAGSLDAATPADPAGDAPGGAATLGAALPVSTLPAKPVSQPVETGALPGRTRILDLPKMPMEAPRDAPQHALPELAAAPSQVAPATPANLPALPDLQPAPTLDVAPGAEAAGPGLLRPDGPAQPAQASNTPGAPAAIPLDTRVPGWTDRMASDIAGARLTGGQDISLSLTPEHLGHLQIRLSVENGAAQIQILAEHPEAARLLADAQPRLADALARFGLDLAQHTTDVMGSGAQSQRDQGQPAYPTAPDTAEAEAPPTEAPPDVAPALPRFSRIDRIA
ncbi:MAG: flagellar hook-length control protein FliK [Pseudomonadota bacterium]